MEPMLMILPRPRAIMPGATARAQRNIDVRFVASTVSHSSSLTSTVFFSRMMPALLTRMSMGPSAFSASFTAAVTWAPCVTSSRSAQALPPADSISAAADLT